MNLVNIIGIALVILIVKLMDIATRILSILNAHLTVIARLVLIVGLMVFAMKNTIITDSVIRTAIVQLTTTVPLVVFATTCTTQSATHIANARLILIVARMGTVTEDD